MARLRRIGQIGRNGEVWDVVCGDDVIGDAAVEHGVTGWFGLVTINGEDVLTEKHGSRTAARRAVGAAVRKQRCGR
jgi:hypothetical protein